MVNRTIPLEQVRTLGMRWRKSRGRRTAIKDMCAWIKDRPMRRSSALPDMLLQAHSITRDALPAERVRYREYINKVSDRLAARYKASRGVSKLSGYTPSRLRALAKLCVDSKFDSLIKLDKVYLTGRNDLRAALPTCFLAKGRSEASLLALYYNSDEALFDKHGLTATGQSVLGGLSRAFSDLKGRDSYGLPYKVPEVRDVLLVDISRQRANGEARVIQLSSQRGQFIARYKRGLLEDFDNASALYRAACRKLKLDPNAHRLKQDNSKPAKGNEAAQGGKRG